MASIIDLAVRLSETGASAVADDLDAVGRAAQGMADDVSKAASKADDGASKFDKLGGTAESMDDKFGRATGAMGALGSGLELVGATGAAEALAQVSMATDFVSGAGQALMLVTESSRIATLKDTAAKIISTTVSKAQAAATWAMTIAQRAFNVAMKANPIGLIITAAFLLIGLFVLLYKKNAAFRAGVQAAGKIAKQVFAVVITVLKKLGGVIKTVAGWVVSKLKPVWAVVGAAVRIAIGIARNVLHTLVGTVHDVVAKIGHAWQTMKSAASAVFGKLRNIISAPFEAAKRLAVGVFGSGGAIQSLVQKLIGIVEGMVNTVIRAINHAIDLINKLPGVNVGHIPEVGRSAPHTSGVAAPAARGAGHTAGTASTGGTTVINVRTLDPYRAATEIERLLRRRGMIVGRRAS